MAERFEEVFKKPVGLSRAFTSVIELESLGRGGFGRVVKVLDQLDRKTYAVKRIQINLDGKNPTERFQEIMQEVSHLSSLNHPNIVRYYHSTIEETDDPAESESSESRVTNTSEFDYGTEDPCVQFGLEDASEDVINTPECQEEYVSDGIHTHEETDVQKGESFERKPKVYDICIRMEYCSNNLKDYIRQDLLKDTDIFWRILKQILSGLEYIHEHGIIHRDINPSNILLTETMTIKIGDFGLATTETRKSISGSKASRKEYMVNHDEALTSSSARDETSCLTGGVGTQLYAAPETQAGDRCKYDQKSDMYSLGLTVFEMSHKPMQSDMEKVEVFRELKARSHFPIDFYESDKSMQVRIIRCLVQNDPSQRPSAKEILDARNNYLPASLDEDLQFQNKHREILRDHGSHRRVMLFQDIFNEDDDMDSDPLLDDHIKHFGDKSMEEFQIQIRNDFTDICRQHGAKQFDLPLLVPRTRQSKLSGAVQLADQTGTILTLPHDPNYFLARYLAQQDVDDIKLYSICPVYKSEEDMQPQRHRIYAFYNMTSTKSNFHIAELLAMLYQFVCKNRFLQDIEWQFVLGNTSLTESFLADLGIKDAKYDELIKYASKLQLLLSVKRLMSLGVCGKEAVRAVRCFHPKKMEIVLSNRGERIRSFSKSERTIPILDTTLSELQQIWNLAKNMGMHAKVYFAVDLLRYMKYTSGFMFVMRARLKSSPKRFLYVAHGGECDNLLNQLKTPSLSTKAEEQRTPYLIGFNVFSNSLVEISKMESQRKQKPSVPTVAIICKKDGDCNQDNLMTSILQCLWKESIPVNIYFSKSKVPVTSDCIIDIDRELGPQICVTETFKDYQGDILRLIQTMLSSFGQRARVMILTECHV